MDTARLFEHWGAVREGLFQALDGLSDAQLAFKPGEGLWSLGRTACHIAETEEGWFRHAATRELADWPEFHAEDYSTIATVKALISSVHDRTVQVFSQDDWAGADEMMKSTITLPWGEKTTLGWIVWHVLEHEIHHRGEIYLMLGLMGMEAPDV